MFHGSGKNVQILHKQARGATRTDQNVISELSRTPLLKQTAVQCTIRDLTGHIDTLLHKLGWI